MEVITNKIVFILLVCFAIWLIVDQIRFTLYKGPIKRGVKIFQIPMTHEMQIFFKTLDGEIVEYNYFNLRSAFIKMNDKREFLIRGRYFTGAPIIGFVDLSAGNSFINIILIDYWRSLYCVV